MHLVIVSGLSGSGKSVALNLLEDLDFYCIDNVPAALLDTLVTEIFATRDSNYANLALGVDARNRPRDLDSVPGLIQDLRKRGIRCEVIFLHADDDTDDTARWTLVDLAVGTGYRAALAVLGRPTVVCRARGGTGGRGSPRAAARSECRDLLV